MRRALTAVPRASPSSSPSPPAGGGDGDGEGGDGEAGLTVLAAASLTDVFERARDAPSRRSTTSR